MKKNEHVCNCPKERSNVSGTITVLPKERSILFLELQPLYPITTLNHHVTATAPPNGASLNLQTWTYFTSETHNDISIICRRNCRHSNKSIKIRPSDLHTTLQWTPSFLLMILAPNYGDQSSNGPVTLTTTNIRWILTLSKTYDWDL